MFICYTQQVKQELSSSWDGRP